VKTIFTINFNILSGYVAMLLAAFVVIRAAPNGINDLLLRVRRSFARRAAAVQD
jgi:hypothetical protein